jgi:hypothetical protein
MNAKGDLEFSYFTDDEIRLGELRANISEMKEDGFTFMGEEVNKHEVQ